MVVFHVFMVFRDNPENYLPPTEHVTDQLKWGFKRAESVPESNLLYGAPGRLPVLPAAGDPIRY